MLLGLAAPFCFHYSFLTRFPGETGLILLLTYSAMGICMGQAILCLDQEPGLEIR